MDLAPQILPREKGDDMRLVPVPSLRVGDVIARDVELLVRQRNATQRELDLFKGSTESWAELHKAEVDRLNAEIDRLIFTDGKGQEVKF